ncbi:hypothetical protein H0E87_008097 [Populus deltoides]|uniref:Zinc finger A20 and AN1 domain-containing stress-associated protein 3 n=1 Tax=Populus deltoides TaxID=3696 RepID=A0A8T2YZ17_POPDE|nr:hypothetical protein H0E87_008097 [Populus deltoides]
MAEEQHRCQEQRLCVNNCGFYGSQATENLCSKCYRDLHQSQPLNHQLLKPSSSSAASVSSFSSPAVDVLKVNTNQKAPVVVVRDDKKDEEKAGEPAAGKQQQHKPNRCLTCRRRVGLTGFKCRCGMVFCGTHRYPEQHDCEFDFKSLGKQQIAKANPVVKGEKLQKI